MFGLVLAGGAVVFLALAVNVQAAALLAFAIFFYIAVYTAWLKRSTPQNIVIGGAAGALPPVIGWAAATGEIGLEPLILFLIIFLWTPPHFWALSLNRADDYGRAGVPMLPVVAGRAATTRQILIYSLLWSRFRCCRGRWGLPARFTARLPPSAARCSSCLPRDCEGPRPIGKPLTACSRFPFSTCLRCLPRCWPTVAAMVDPCPQRRCRNAAIGSLQVEPLCTIVRAALVPISLSAMRSDMRNALLPSPYSAPRRLAAAPKAFSIRKDPIASAERLILFDSLGIMLRS